MEQYNKELCEERHSRIEDRLLKHGEQIDSLEGCIIKLTEMIERHDNECKESARRISEIESRPVMVLGKIMGYTLMAILGAISSWLVQYFDLFA